MTFRKEFPFHSMFVTSLASIQFSSNAYYVKSNNTVFMKNMVGELLVVDYLFQAMECHGHLEV